MDTYINKNNVMELLLNKITLEDVEKKPSLYSAITGVKEMNGFMGFAKPEECLPKNEEEVHVIFLSRSGHVGHAIATYLKKGTKIVDEEPPVSGGSKEERLLNAIFGGTGKERQAMCDGFYLYECGDKGLFQWSLLNTKVIAWMSLTDMEKMIPGFDKKTEEKDISENQ